MAFATVINPQDPDAVRQVLDLTGGLGADKAIETSGTAPAKPFLMDATRRKGYIAFVGWEGQLDAGQIILKGLTIHGAWHYSLYGAGRLPRVIAASGDQLDRLITHRFPLSRVQDAWELQLSGNCGKMVLHPWG
jgi:threonine dehydrogenase-like Zn-dependent dehydrogenase